MRGASALFVLLSGLVLPAAAVHAALVSSLTPDREIASGGDAVSVQLRLTVSGAALTNLRYTYAIPSTARYVANSVILDGAVVPDDDPRVEVDADSLHVVLASVGVGGKEIGLRIRAAGSAGVAIPHDAILTAAGIPGRIIHGPPTWIEDENAVLYVPSLLQDTFISESEALENFGASPSVELRTGNRRRGLLQFDIGAVLAGLPAGTALVAARLELWPTVAADGAVTVNVHRVKQTWTEGSQSGGLCTSGATWLSRNCLALWTAGGDFDGGTEGSATWTASTAFAAIDIRPLALDWISGGRPNQGLLLEIAAATSGNTVSFPSREGKTSSGPAARLVLIVAPSWAYPAKAVKDAKADIVPTTVISNLPGQEFVYTVKPSFDGGSTGMNRLQVTIPAPFVLRQVDSVSVDGRMLDRSEVAKLVDGEYEDWSGDGTIDVRFAPKLDGTSVDPRVVVYFRAGTPPAADAGKNFTSVVDDDRRGYAPQAAAKGDANGLPGDGNTWQVVTTAANVLSVEVAPASVVTRLGEWVPYTATAHYSEGTAADVSEFATWVVSPSALGTFGPEPGRLHVEQAGSGIVVAGYGGVFSPPSTLTVDPASLVELRIDPAIASIPAGRTVQLRALGIYTNGDTLDVTDAAVWSSADTTVATIVAPGRVQGWATGKAGILAALDGKGSAPATIEVTPAVLESIQIAPSDTTLALGFAIPLIAEGTYSDGSRTDLTSVVHWTAQPTGIVDIDADGVATTLAIGAAAVRAAFGAVISPAASFTVLPPVVVALAVSPADTSIALGYSLQMQAAATWSDGAVEDVTAAAVWRTTPAGIAAVDASGHLHTLAEGTTAVTAELDSTASAPASLTVGPAVLKAITVAPGDTTLALGDSLQLSATGTWSNGGTSDVTSTAVWQAVPAGIVLIDASGLETTTAEGTTTITANLAGVTSPPVDLIVRIDVPLVDSVAVSPRPLRLPRGARLSLAATASYDDGTTSDVTPQASWSSSDSTIAAIDHTGEVEARAAGECAVVARWGGATSIPCSVTVDTAALDSLVVAPADTSLRRVSHLGCRAWGHVGSWVFDLTTVATWTAADTTVTAVVAPGSLVTRGEGTTTVLATLDGFTGSPATLRVTPAEVVRTEVLPLVSTLRLGSTKSMSARATYSDGATTDVSGSAAWSSDAPSIVYADAQGLATAVALGSAHITAAAGGVTSAPATLTVLPAVVFDGIATGDVAVLPGSWDRLVQEIRVTNRYTDVRRLLAVRFGVRGPMTRLRLRLDDGDGAFEPGVDPIVAEGVPAAGSWTASPLAIDFPVGTPEILFASADISLDQSSQGDSVDVWIPGPGDLYWGAATAVVAPAGFPLQSPGAARVGGLVLAQIDRFPTPGDSVLAGSAGTPVLDLEIPADGPLADVLQDLTVTQIGTASSGTDIARLRLERGPAPWTEIAVLSPTGGGRWAASGIGAAVPAGGRRVRVVADLTPTAQSGRTLQLELPRSGLGFQSGRIGPSDSVWVNPHARSVRSQRILTVGAVQVAQGETVARRARRLPVFGLDVTVVADLTDTLQTLRLENVSTNAAGPAADRGLEIELAELWVDADADGGVGGADVRLEALAPGSGSELAFGIDRPLDLALAPGVTTRLLVTLSPDSLRVRDGEQLGVRLASAADIGSATGLAAQLQGSMQTLSGPVVDGQSASGYTVNAIGTTILASRFTEAVMLDLEVPANGIDPDTLVALRLDNAGSAAGDEVGPLRLYRDDGDGVQGTSDALVGVFTATGDRSWSLTNIEVPLPVSPAARFFVTMEPGNTAFSGRTFQARVPRNGITVTSGNDGPLDQELDGGGPAVLAVANQVLWVAGIAGSHAVRPDVRNQPVLVLETLNTYNRPRTLDALVVDLRGSATDAEFENWQLVADDDRNGQIDDADRVLAVAAPFEQQVRFEGFAYVLESLVQQRLIVTYSGALGSARDGSTIDAAISNSSSFVYDDAAATTTAAQFELNAAGQDTFDGCVLRQIVERPVTSRTLGGGEQNVLVLDLQLPSNGVAADQLNALEVEIVPQPASAVLGEDLENIRLWAESDVGGANPTFDPAQDALLATLIPGEIQLRFDGLAMPIPPGGRYVYVTTDVAPSPTDGRVLQMQLPPNGLTMLSGDDGPLDGALPGIATHRISRSQILSSIATSQAEASTGQPVDVAIVVENRGSTPLSNVRLQRLEVIPPRPGSLVADPVPDSLALAPGAVDTFTCRFLFGVPGTVRIEGVAGLADSSVVGNAATSGPVKITHPASGLALELLSNVPGSVYRGQRGVVPLVWRFSHPDTDSLAAPVALQALAFRIDDGGGAFQLASAVFDRLELRAGNRSLASFDPAPDSSWVHAVIDPPLELLPGEERDVSLSATVGAAATVNSFRLRVLDATAVAAGDWNSGSAVPLQATLPWSSPIVAVRSITTTLELAATPLLPRAVNQGQTSVPVAQLQLSVPGAPGASDARLTRLALDVRRPDGAALDLGRVFRRLEVTSGTVVLLETTSFDTTGGQVVLPLTIAKTVTSGAPETIALGFDLWTDAPQDSMRIRILDADQVTVVDAIQGTPVPVAIAPPDSFPVDFGTFVIQHPAGPAALAAVSRLPGTAAAGAPGLAMLGLQIRHEAAPGSAGLDFTRLVVRTIDATGAPVVPHSALKELRLLADGTPVASVTSPPDVGSSVTIAPAATLRIAAGDSLQLELTGDLATPGVPWLRLALDVNGIELHDANDPARPVAPTGSIPFATALMHVLIPATAVALGVPADPAANAPAGASGFEILTVRVAHPGSAGQSDVAPAFLVIAARDPGGRPIAVDAFAAAARLRLDGSVFEAALAADSLRFDLAGAPAIGPGDALDLVLALDLLAVPAVQDVRFALDAGALVAGSGATSLPVQALDGSTLPYLSPSVHILAASLAASFANYPNPFAAGREATRIVFNLPQDARVTVDVYDLTGEPVIRLRQATPMSAGLHDDLSWDGRNRDGSVVRNGTYLLRLVVDGPQGGKFLRKLAVLR